MARARALLPARVGTSASIRVDARASTIVILLSLLLLAVAGSARGQATSAEPAPDGRACDGFCPNRRPALDVHRARGPIQVDGMLGDSGWIGASRATNFAENFPVEQARPVAETEVLVAYDDDALYLAFIAHEPSGSVRVSRRDRDEVWGDDRVGILLDTYGDASWAYFLFANPLGLQADSRFATSGGEDDGFDLIYRSRGRVTPDGYVVEMAIPFKSLRFPDRPVQEWRATFWRTHQRGSQRTSTWAALDRDEPCFLCQFGTLRGIEGVKPGSALELMPTMVLSQAGARSDPGDPTSAFENDAVDVAPSLGIRYAFANGLTAEAALNPDFSQVESDVGQIDVNTTFALFFPERRPFFQEASDLFDTWIDGVYTRSINDPQGAARLTGRRGRTSIAYIAARDETSPLLLPFEERSFVAEAGGSVSNILRARQTFGGNESFLGFLATDRRFETGGGSNSVLGGDLLLRFARNYRLEFQLLGSRTAEPREAGATAALGEATFDRGARTSAFDGESFWGHAQYTSLERSARLWSFDFDYWAFSPTFRADNGFVTRNDSRRLSMWQGLNLYPNAKVVDRIQPGLFVEKAWNFDGRSKRELLELALNADLTGQTFVNLFVDLENERFRDVEFRGILRSGLFVRSNFSEPVQLGVFISPWAERIARNLATPLLGRGTSFEAFATLKPISRLVISPSLNYSELHRTAQDREPGEDPEIFAGAIFRTRATFQFTRELFLRLIVQYDEFGDILDLEPLLTYKINPFTLFFVGSTVRYRDFAPSEGAGLEPGREAFGGGLAQSRRQFFAKFQYLLRF